MDIHIPVGLPLQLSLLWPNTKNRAPHRSLLAVAIKEGGVES